MGVPGQNYSNLNCSANIIGDYWDSFSSMQSEIRRIINLARATTIQNLSISKQNPSVSQQLSDIGPKPQLLYVLDVSLKSILQVLGKVRTEIRFGLLSNVSKWTYEP